jgi:nickel-dependent lactate racemase
LAEFNLPYGCQHLSVSLPDEWQVELLMPQRSPTLPDPLAGVDQALDRPLGGQRLSDWAGVRSAAIAISDKTRPVPHQILLPPLLQRLEGLGLRPEAIRLLIATGAHPPMEREEFRQILPPDIIERYPVASHSAQDRDHLTYLGTSGRGTPIWINRAFIQADLRVVVGNIEPHQFVGFSGGVKSAAIGLAGIESISHNHAMMRDNRARLARFEDNPTRQDMEEIGRRIGVHFALNAIVNESKQVVAVLAGEPGQVMRAGMPLVRDLYGKRVSAPFDLVLASPGGHPKDINLYQAQKALAHAALVTKEGGAIILAAACPEGTGSRSFQAWMEATPSYQAVFERFEREGFRIGPHKAYLIARDAARLRVVLVSAMAPDLVRRLLLRPAQSLDEALSLVQADRSRPQRVAVMPWANATIPILAVG